MTPDLTPEDVTLDQLTTDPHPVLARLRADHPVAWVPALGGWLVTSHDLAVAVMRDPSTFTVDDPRFSTARVVGPSMLSLDGAEHTRHRAPFLPPFRPAPVRDRFTPFLDTTAQALADALPPNEAELRSAYAGPLAVAVVADALGLVGVDAATVLSWYETIVDSVSAVTAGGPPTDAGECAYTQLRTAVATSTTPPAAGPEPTADSRTTPANSPGPAADARATPADDATGGEAPGAGDPRTGSLAGGSESGPCPGGAGRPSGAGESTPGGAGAHSVLVAASATLTEAEVVANAAVLMFGGIDTTAGMITNLVRHLLLHRAELTPGAVEESLRLEPAAAVVDRYATRDVELGGASVKAGDLVVVSIAGANRDPAVFTDPDTFDPLRPNARQHLAFAQGPHFCLGARLARAETTIAARTLFDRLPGLRLVADDPPRGLVFRRPPALRVGYDR